MVVVVVYAPMYAPDAQYGALNEERGGFSNQALTVHHHTRGGTLSEGRGTGCHNTLPRNSAAVLAARALVPNSIDDGAGAFEHKARTLGEAAVVVCRRALSREGCVPAPQS